MVDLYDKPKPDDELIKFTDKKGVVAVRDKLGRFTKGYSGNMGGGNVAKKKHKKPKYGYKQCPWKRNKVNEEISAQMAKEDEKTTVKNMKDAMKRTEDKHGQNFWDVLFEQAMVEKNPAILKTIADRMPQELWYEFAEVKKDEVIREITMTSYMDLCPKCGYSIITHSETKEGKAWENNE